MQSKKSVAFSALKLEREIQNVFSSGTRINNSHFVLYFRPTDKKEIRTTVFISKKIVKTAVARNRVRRLIKEVFRQTGWAKGFDFICVVKECFQKSANLNSVQQMLGPLLSSA